MFDDPRPLGLRTATKVRNVSHRIWETEQLVTRCGPSRANLRPAKEALTSAKALLAARKYAEAVAQADRAGVLANSLNERFDTYMAAWKALQARMEELQRLGLPTDTLEAALDAADQEVAHLVDEDGARVSNYLGATETLAHATEVARRVIDRARVASREIFLASLAVEALSESGGAAMHGALTLRLEEAVEQASRELALGHVSAARKMASEARVRADGALVGGARARHLLEQATATLAGLQARGPVADSLEEKAIRAWQAFSQGIPDAATMVEVARRVRDEVAAFAKGYRPSRDLLDDAERVHGGLREEGFRSNDVDAALCLARHALEEGDWPVVKEKVSLASQAFVRLREEREGLAQAITEIAARVNTLKVCRLPLLPAVEDILGRASEEILTCRLPEAREDLGRANALMMRATATGS